MERKAKDGTIYKQVGPDDWQAVTRKAKDGTTYKKVGADEWVQLTKPEPSRMEAAGRGLAQGVTLGYSDEIVGAARGIYDDMKSVFTGEPQNPDAPKPIRDEFGRVANADQLTGSYEAHRDKSRQANDEAREAHPWTYGAAEVGGGIATAAMPGLNIARGAQIGQVAAKSALAGGVAGSGYSEADSVGGVLEDTGKGAALGAGLGVAANKAIGKIAGKAGATTSGRAASRASAKQRINANQEGVAQGTAQSGAKSSANISGGALEVEQGGKLFDFKAPQSLDELRNWTPQNEGGQLLGKQRLSQIEQSVPDLQTKPLKYHYDMMDNPKAMKELKLTFENLPTADAKKIAAYNQQIVDESGSKITKTVNEIAGGIEPKRIGDAGDDFINVVKQKYNAEKDMLRPAFDELRRSGGRLTKNESKDLIVGISENSNLGKLLEQSTDTGRFTLRKNTPRSGISNKEHSLLKSVIDDLNDGMSFSDLQKTREFLRKSVDPANPSATAEINKVRSIMLGQMEEMANKRGPKVGETFKSYAKNERARESIEKIIGGKVETLDAMFASNPERVVKKLFSNPNHAKIAADYIGPENMQQMIGAYIKDGLRKAYDPAKGFNPSAVRNWISQNDAFLKNNVDPRTVERLNALADYGYYGKRFLDEVNPSGTAASLKEMIEPKGFFQNVRQGNLVGAVANETIGRVGATVKQRQAVKALNQSLAGKPSSFTSEFIDQVVERFAGSNAVDIAAGIQGGKSAASKAVKDLSTAVASENKEEKKFTTNLKGREAWAVKGLENIISHSEAAELLRDPEIIKVLLSTAKGQRLLMSASSMDSKSKSLQKIVSRLNEEIEKAAK